MTSPDPDPAHPRTSPSHSSFGRRLHRAWHTPEHRRRLLLVLAAFVAVDVAILVGALAAVGVLSSDPAASERGGGLPAFVEPEQQRLAPAFAAAARESRVPLALLEGLTWRESRWQTEARNPESGAIGIGQLLPETAQFAAEGLLHDPTLDPQRAPDNIRLTAAYLRFLLDRFDDDPRLAIAAFLQGSTSVTNDGVSEASEGYLQDVMAFRQQFASAARR